MEQTPFEQLSLTPEIRRAVADMGFTLTTDIQAQSIPLIQSGQDVIGRSQTGTGKTVAFGIPAIGAVDTEGPDKYAAQVLILCPTRELAVQACGELKKLSRYTPGIRCADVYGGAPMDRQILRLKTANIVIGTPGRLLDHLRRRTLRLDHIRLVVLDEADEMLSMGFREDIEAILTETPEERQTVLFSATMPPAILALTRRFQKDPVMIHIAHEQETVENVGQFYYEVPMGRKLEALERILRYHTPRLTLVFCNTKRMVDEIAVFLEQRGFAALGLHGDMKQSQRNTVMEAFRHGRTGILVATDVAARGIDVNDIDYVINYDIPQSAEYYVHRIGRTGRAGKSGCAITLCSGRRQVGELMTIARLTKTEVTPLPVPTVQTLWDKQCQDIAGRLEQAAAAGAGQAYRPLVDTLVEKGLDPAAMVAAVLESQYGAPQTAAGDDWALAKSSSGGMPRAGGYQKITIDIGRRNRVAPNHIVGALTGRTSLTGRDIGKIEIYDDETLVSIPESQVEDTIAAMANCPIVGRTTVTSRCRRDTGGAPRQRERPYRAGGTPRRASKGRTDR